MQSNKTGTLLKADIFFTSYLGMSLTTYLAHTIFILQGKEFYIEHLPFKFALSLGLEPIVVVFEMTNM